MWASEEQHQEFRARVEDSQRGHQHGDGFCVLFPTVVPVGGAGGGDCAGGRKSDAISVVTMIRDVSAARNPERALEENEAAHRAISTSVQIPVLIPGASDGGYLAVNAEFLRLGSPAYKQPWRWIWNSGCGTGRMSTRNIHRHPRDRVRYATSRSIFCAATELSSRP